MIAISHIRVGDYVRLDYWGVVEILDIQHGMRFITATVKDVNEKIFHLTFEHNYLVDLNGGNEDEIPL